MFTCHNQLQFRECLCWKRENYAYNQLRENSYFSSCLSQYPMTAVRRLCLQFVHGRCRTFNIFHLGEHRRGYSLKLFKPRAVTTIRQPFFSHLVIDDWNSLLQTVMETTSTNMFKNRLDRYCRLRPPDGIS